MEWISVKNKLPENGDRVLVYDGDFVDFAEYQCDEFGAPYYGQTEGQIYNDILFWSKLPDPPKLELSEFCECKEHGRIDRNRFCSKCGGQLKGVF